MQIMIKTKIMRSKIKNLIIDLIIKKDKENKDRKEII